MSAEVVIQKKVIALAGQPNTGKSTLFNQLTGSRQHVGNWPGKTVEQKRGSFFAANEEYEVIDLPGTYSLTSGSLEETISRNFLIAEDLDMVVVLADASQLERSLYLLAEVLPLGLPTVLALNMMDVAAQHGVDIDTTELERQFKVPVIPMKANRGEGLSELIEQLSSIEFTGKQLCGPDFSGKLKKRYDVICELLAKENAQMHYLYWSAAKLLENDEEVRKEIKERCSQKGWSKIESELKDNNDGELLVADARYKWIHSIIEKAVRYTEKDKKSLLRGFDRFATHPVFGKIIAFGVLFLSFAVAMVICMPIMQIVQAGIGFAIKALGTVGGMPHVLSSFLTDGLLPAVGMGLAMLGFIFAVYLVFGILENTGYLARLAFVFDDLMHHIGLHGKSFMPLIMSFGCNIAGVTGTRVIDSWRQRMVTLILVSILPCMALWAVVGFMGAIFFGSQMPLVVLALFAVMVLHLVVTSVVMRRFVVKGREGGLIMELPPYHKPHWKTVWRYVSNQVKGFTKRAVTLIAFITLVVWALSYQSDGNIENSILAHIGKFFDPVSSLIGLNWQLFVALIAAVAAKEASLVILAVLYGIGKSSVPITGMIFGGAGGYEHDVLESTLFQSISPESALAFLFAFFFSIPCIGTIATVYSESKSLKWTLGASAYYTGASFIFAFIAYHAGMLIF